MPAQMHRDAIREIFLRRRAEYTAQEAARLLGTTGEELLDSIADGDLDLEAPRMRKQPGAPRLRTVCWSELASAALLRWTVMEIHDALGDDAPEALPRLLRPVELKNVRLPEYQVRLLEALARKDGVTVEGYVHTALLSVETAMSEAELERMLPGFTEAIRFPDA